MKRHAISALIAANLFLLLLACTNERIVGPVGAAITDVWALISRAQDNTLSVDDQGLLYVAPVSASDLLSADSANALRIGNDGLLYTAVLSGSGGARGPEGPEGPAGPEGPQGPPGTSVTIMGSVAAANQLPNTAAPGDGWLVDGDLWVWSGNGWNNVGKIQGPQGEPGRDGKDGEPGKPGKDGKDGTDGPKGDKGDPGDSVEPIDLISSEEENEIRVGEDGKLYIFRVPRIVNRYPSVLAERVERPNGSIWQGAIILQDMDLPFVVFTCMYQGQDSNEWVPIGYNGVGPTCSVRQEGRNLRFGFSTQHPQHPVHAFRVNVIHTTY